MLFALVPVVALPVSAVPTTLGEQSIGAVVSFEVGGTLTEFIVVHQGSPSADYVGFEGGTVLLSRRLLEPSRRWNSVAGAVRYNDSDIHRWLNGDFIASIEPSAVNRLSTVRIPYVSDVSIMTGANGLQCRVFLLSYRELNGTIWNGVPDEGAVFSFFAETTGLATRRQALRANNTTASWWSRSPRVDSTRVGTVQVVETSGTTLENSRLNMGTLVDRHGYVRPALVLPQTVQVGADGRLLFGVDPPITEPPTTSATEPTTGGGSTDEPSTTSEPDDGATDKPTDGASPENDDELTAMIKEHIVMSRVMMILGAALIASIGLYKLVRLVF
jgi:hypothetical protein